MRALIGMGMRFPVVTVMVTSFLTASERPVLVTYRFQRDTNPEACVKENLRKDSASLAYSQSVDNQEDMSYDPREKHIGVSDFQPRWQKTDRKSPAEAMPDDGSR